MMYADQFEFVGEGLEMLPYQVSPYLPASTAQQRFDLRRLKAFVRDDCELERPRAWLESADSIKCTSNRTTEIAYLSPASRNLFYMPEFPPRFYFSDFSGFFFYPLILLVLLSLPAFPFVVVTSVFYSILLGRESDLDIEIIDAG
jgi:hypothetical protein